jgi:hypothetical protein
MPNSRQHKEKAARNREFLDTISVDDYPDWAVVVAFYAAVHLAERLRTLERNASQQHSTDHNDRLQFVQRKHRGIHAAFHILFNAALLARYETVNSFNTQFTPSDVRDTLVGQHLVSIERYVSGKFGGS